MRNTLHILPGGMLWAWGQYTESAQHSPSTGTFKETEPCWCRCPILGEDLRHRIQAGRYILQICNTCPWIKHFCSVFQTLLYSTLSVNHLMTAFVLDVVSKNQGLYQLRVMALEAPTSLIYRATNCCSLNQDHVKKGLTDQNFIHWCFYIQGGYHLRANDPPKYTQTTTTMKLILCKTQKLDLMSILSEVL